MRAILYMIGALLLLSSCKPQGVKKPSWSNPTDTLKLPSSQLIFRADSADWKVTLLTAIQPIELPANFKSKKLIVNVDAYGITEGNAQICLSSGEHYFYYNVCLLNKRTPKVFNKEYRSPKTVNPDSSLQQQRVFHRIDAYRNLVQFKKHNYFGEDQITMTSKTGVYRITENTPLTAVYVQPGSTTTIAVSAKYDLKEDTYKVKAGPMRDKYNNLVADGTSVAFVYNNGSQTYRMEAVALNGFSQVSIPAVKTISYSLVAEVNKICSNPIYLTN